MSVCAGALLLIVAAGIAPAAPTTTAGADRVAAAVAGMTAGSGTPQPSNGQVVSLAGTGLVDRSRWADADGDGIADRVEEALCGAATCAVPWADVDGDGVPDATDVLVCGQAGCVDARRDADADRIPDFVGVLLCGDGGCPRGTLRADVDGDGVENWVEALIAGNALDATGREDLDGDGIADAAALMECLRFAGRLATTGAEVRWLLVAACAVGGAGLVLLGWRDLHAGRATTRGAGA
jgi:hypothetical protein